MQKDSVIRALMGVLTLSAIASAVVCVLWVKDHREARHLNEQALFINNRNAVLQSLAVEVVQYSRAHPDPQLEAILSSVNIRTRPAVTNNPR